MGLVEAIGDVGGDAVGYIGAEHVRGHAIEDDIADRVGDEVNAAVAREIGELHVGAIDRALQRGDPEIALLELILVEGRGIEGGDAVGGEVRHLAGGVGYLVAAVCGAGDESEPRVRIEQGRDIAEAPLLRGMIMNRVPVRRRIFQPDIALEETSGDKVLRLSDGAAVFDARRERTPAAAVDADVSRIVEGVAARPDIENAGRAQAELRRQGSGNQRYVADQRGIEEGAEAADAVRKHDAVDAGLHIGMLVADVEIAAGGRILGNSRKPEHDLLDRGVRALRQRLDRVVADRCSAPSPSARRWC